MGMLPAPIILVCLFLVFAPVRSAVQLSNQYDNNRWFQLLILVAVALFYFVDMVTRRDQPFLVTQKKPLPKFTIIILVAFSVVSAATSSYPLWAFTELSLYLLLAVLCISVYAASREQGTKVDNALIMTFVFSAFLFICKFYLDQLEAAEDANPFSWIAPFGIFGNVRFFSQYQAYTLPLMALPLLATNWHKAWRISATVIGAIWWALQFAVATRAVWVAVLITFLLLVIFLRRESKQFLLVQATLIFGGGLLYFVFDQYIFTNMPGLGSVAGRGLDSSLRLPLWSAAIDMAVQSPLLGAGPYHFALIDRDIPAHPHNAWLQILGEYGVVAALIVAYLVFKLIKAGIDYCKNATSLFNREMNIALLAALVMGLTASLLEGNTLMPHSQVALMVVTGWLMGRNATEARFQVINNAGVRNKWLLGYAVTVTFSVAIIALYTHDYFAQPQPKSGAFPTVAHPRFWINGKWPVQ